MPWKIIIYIYTICMPYVCPNKHTKNDGKSPFLMGKSLLYVYQAGYLIPGWQQVASPGTILSLSAERPIKSVLASISWLSSPRINTSAVKHQGRRCDLYRQSKIDILLLILLLLLFLILYIYILVYIYICINYLTHPYTLKERCKPLEFLM